MFQKLNSSLFKFTTLRKVSQESRTLIQEEIEPVSEILNIMLIYFNSDVTAYLLLAEVNKKEISWKWGQKHELNLILEHRPFVEDVSDSL